MDYVPHPSFTDPAARAAILGPIPGSPDEAAPRRVAARRGLIPAPAGFFEVPPLTAEQERHLFRKMNYLKHCVAALRARIDPQRARTTDLDRLERLQEAAAAAKDRIVCANLRLVAWIAHQFVRPSDDFSELLSDGIEVLLRVVDRFDFARGNKFSTYATWAMRRQFGKTLHAQDRRGSRMITGLDESFLAAIGDREDEGEGERERSLEGRRKAVAGLLGRLDDRERRIIVGRYGLDGAHERTLKDLGQELGISKERVRQIESQAHHKLRAFAGSRELDLLPT